MKKKISILLVIAMCLTLSVPAFATEQYDLYNTNVIDDNSDVRIVQTSDEHYTYTATFDKEAKTLQLVQVNNATGEVVTGDIVPVKEFSENLPVQTRASLEENTWTNYEYTKTYGNPNEWELRAPGDNIFTIIYFKTYEEEDNEVHLSDFMDAVDEVNTTEGVMISSVGLYGLSVLAAGAAGAGAIFTGGTLSSAAWAALLAAGGFAKEALDACTDYDQACKDAYDSFWETFYASEVFY